MFFELINRFNMRSPLARFKTHVRYLSSIQEERRLLSGRVYMVIILELCKQKESNPVVLPLVDKKAEILFQLSVDSLCLSVTLGMVGCSCC